MEVKRNRKRVGSTKTERGDLMNPGLFKILALSKFGLTPTTSKFWPVCKFDNWQSKSVTNVVTDHILELLINFGGKVE